MGFEDLRSFVRALEEQGQLKRVEAEVDPELEITQIADRMSKSPSLEGMSGAPQTDPVHGGMGGYALLFDSVRGSDVPLGINLFGSYRRMMMALGCDSFEALAERVQRLIKPPTPTSLMDKVKMLPELAKISGYAPKQRKNGICQEVVLRSLLLGALRRQTVLSLIR